MSNFWRSIVGWTFRKESDEQKLQSDANGFNKKEIDKIADSLDDYHPNTPSSSVASEKDLMEREKQLSASDDNEFDEGGLINAFENMTISDNLSSVDLIKFTNDHEKILPDDLIDFISGDKDLIEETCKQINGATNNEKILILDDTETSSDLYSTSSKTADQFKNAGARPKMRNKSVCFNYSDSTYSTVLDNFDDGASALCAVSQDKAESKKHYEYPILFLSPQGTISIHLRENCIVEITVNKTIRVECQGKFSAASNAHGSVNCILHPDARILQQDARVQCLFGKTKFASFSPGGVVFSMKPSPMAYVVSSTVFKGTTSVPVQFLRVPPMDHDFTLVVLYNQSFTSSDTLIRCHEIVRSANYKYRDDDSIIVIINGIFIRQDRFGNVLINCHPRSIRVSPQHSTVSVRTHFVDMAVQEDEKAYVKRGVKRVLVSKSGMVVSDGNCITAMDHFGRIVSST